MPMRPPEPIHTELTLLLVRSNKNLFSGVVGQRFVRLALRTTGNMDISQPSFHNQRNGRRVRYPLSANFKQPPLNNI
jgi:hypothetical protein